MRVYSKMKELLLLHKDILIKLEKLEKTSNKHDKRDRNNFCIYKKTGRTTKAKTARIGFKKDW